MGRILPAMMNDALLLPVTHRGKEYEFRMKISASGYVPRYFVWINEVEVVFERDDEGAFRAIIYNPEVAPGPLPETSLLESVGSTLEQLTS